MTFWVEFQEIEREEYLESVQEIIDIVTEVAASMERICRQKNEGHFRIKVKFGTNIILS